jgi:hypothetical protein
VKNFVIGALGVTVALSLAGNALLYQRYSNSRPLVKVGGETITKKQYQDAVDYQTQGAILKKMVFASLVTQSATHDGILPTDADVSARIADLQRRNPQALADAMGDTAKMAEMRQDIKTDLALDALRTEGITVTDAEVADFYAHHRSDFALPVQMQTTLIVTDNPVDADTAAGLLRQKMPLDVIARQPRLHVAGLNGFHPDFSTLPTAVNQDISRQVCALHPGGIKTMPLGHQFLTIQVNKALNANVPPLSQIKAEVTRMARLEKAPTPAQELAKLYHKTPVGFEVDKYAAYFADIQNAPADTPAPQRTASAR